jgi:hypothetical protein
MHQESVLWDSFTDQYGDAFHTNGCSFDVAASHTVRRATQVINRRAEWRFTCSLTEILIGVDGEQNIANVAASQ